MGVTSRSLCIGGINIPKSSKAAYAGITGVTIPAAAMLVDAYPLLPAWATARVTNGPMALSYIPTGHYFSRLVSQVVQVRYSGSGTPGRVTITN